MLVTLVYIRIPALSFQTDRQTHNHTHSWLRVLEYSLPDTSI